jgi:O-antigen/teichoic acid export membrane protein
MRGGAPYNFAGIALRLFSVGGKVLLMLYLAEYFSLVELGIYGLFVATNTIAIYVAGFEFYTFTTREILTVDRAEWPRAVASQLRFHAVAYLALGPMIAVVFALGVLPSRTAGWFCLVLICTHATQELYRLLIASSRPLAAYAVSACAHGVWVFPVMGLGLVWPAARNLDVVFGGWAVGAFAATVGGLAMLRRLGLLDRRATGSWALVRRGMKVSWMFFVVALCFRLIDLSDRYFIQWFLGESQVGVYTLYGSVARVLQDLVFTGFVAAVFPSFVAAYQHRDAEEFAARRRQLRRAVIAATAALVPCFVVGVHALLAILDKPAFRAELTSYYILIAAAAVSALTLIPQYSLYAWRRDRVILQAAVLGAAANVALNAVLVPRLGLTGAAIATLAAVALIAAYELIAKSRVRHRHALS